MNQIIVAAPHFSCNFIGPLCFFRFIVDRVLVCSCSSASSSSALGKIAPSHRDKSDPKQYHRISPRRRTAPEDEVSSEVVARVDSDADLIKYVGDEQERKSLQMKGLNLMDKTLSVKGARISFSFLISRRCIINSIITLFFFNDFLNF
ncbi:hypothetical protein V2J09_009480 [Rumex salicifolius]